jgi:hypothetical protein
LQVPEGLTRFILIGTLDGEPIIAVVEMKQMSIQGKDSRFWVMSTFIWEVHIHLVQLSWTL